jgi:hypothetical protein
LKCGPLHLRRLFGSAHFTRPATTARSSGPGHSPIDDGQDDPTHPGVSILKSRRNLEVGIFFGLLDLRRRGDVAAAMVLTHVMIVAATTFLHRRQAHHALREIKRLAQFSRELRCYARSWHGRMPPAAACSAPGLPCGRDEAPRPQLSPAFLAILVLDSGTRTPRERRSGAAVGGTRIATRFTTRRENRRWLKKRVC